MFRHVLDNGMLVRAVFASAALSAALYACGSDDEVDGQATVAGAAGALGRGTGGKGNVAGNAGRGAAIPSTGLGTSGGVSGGAALEGVAGDSIISLIGVAGGYPYAESAGAGGVGGVELPQAFGGSIVVPIGASGAPPTPLVGGNGPGSSAAGNRNQGNAAGRGPAGGAPQVAGASGRPGVGGAAGRGNIGLAGRAAAAGRAGNYAGVAGRSGNNGGVAGRMGGFGGRNVGAGGRAAGAGGRTGGGAAGVRAYAGTAGVAPARSCTDRPKNNERCDPNAVNSCFVSTPAPGRQCNCASATGLWICVNSGSCTPSSRQCTNTGNIPQVCSAAGVWQNQAPCEHVCSGGYCVGACDPGDKQCAAGNVPQTCDTNGAWQPSTACEHVCSAGDCIGVCSPGDKQCASTGNSSQSCNPSGNWVEADSCAFSCAGGDCQPGTWSGTITEAGMSLQLDVDPLGATITGVRVGWTTAGCGDGVGAASSTPAALIQVGEAFEITGGTCPTWTVSGAFTSSTSTATGTLSYEFREADPCSCTSTPSVVQWTANAP